MNQLATLMPALEQALAGLPQGSATPRGAPPDDGGFALALGENLRTLSRPGGTGGESAAGSAGLAADNASIEEPTLNPAALLRDLLTEIGRLAFDAAGGEQALAGRIAGKLRAAIEKLTKPESVTEDGTKSDPQTTQPPLDEVLANLLQQLSAMAPASASVVPTGSAVASSAPSAQPASVVEAGMPAAAASGPAPSPAMLAPLLQSVLQTVLAELQANEPQLQLSGRVIMGAAAAPQTQEPVAVSVASPLTGTPADVGSVQRQSAAATTPQATANLAANPGSDKLGPAVPFGGLEQTAASRSASIDWFNSLAGKHPAAEPAPQLLVAQTGSAASQIDKPADVQAQTALLDGELSLPGAAPLRLNITALRGSALDPIQRLDIQISDPAGTADDLHATLEISSLPAERQLAAGELQRLSAVMQRLLESPAQSVVSKVDGSGQVVRSAAVMDTTPGYLPTQAEQETATQSGQTAKTVIETAGVPFMANQPAREQMATAIPETETARLESSAGFAAKLPGIGTLHQAPGQMPPGDNPPQRTASPITGDLHPQPQLSAVPEGLLALHPQATAVLPDNLLQFSAPPPGSGVGGYAMDEIQQQLMERVSELRKAGDGLYNIKLDLYPKELGRMIVNISVRGDNVAMQLAVVNQGVRPELQRELDDLRRSLEEEGLSVIDMQVISLGEKKGRNSGTGNKSTG